MRGLVHLVVISLASAGAACSPPVQLAFDERRDFAPYRTWDWAGRSSYHIDAPHEDARRLHARVASVIERELHERGFERTRDHRADFFVAYRLVIQRKSTVVRTMGAARTISGFHG